MRYFGTINSVKCRISNHQNNTDQINYFHAEINRRVLFFSKETPQQFNSTHPFWSVIQKYSLILFRA